MVRHVHIAHYPYVVELVCARCPDHPSWRRSEDFTRHRNLAHGGESFDAVLGSVYNPKYFPPLPSPDSPFLFHETSTVVFFRNRSNYPNGTKIRREHYHINTARNDNDTTQLDAQHVWHNTARSTQQHNNTTTTATTTAATNTYDVSCNMISASM